MKIKFNGLLRRALLFIVALALVSSQLSSVVRAVDPSSIKYDTTYGGGLEYDAVKQEAYYSGPAGISLGYRPPLSYTGYIFVKPSGNIYTFAICNMSVVLGIGSKLCVKEFSSTTGHYIGMTELAVDSASASQFSESFAMDSSGNFYLGNPSTNQIFVFSPDGSILRKISTSSTNVQFVDATGKIYVINKSNNQIETLNSNGTQLMQFGSTGTGDGQFTNLKQIAIDSTGAIYALDDTRIQKFSTGGVYQFTIGNTLPCNATFSTDCTLEDITTDNSNNLLISRAQHGILKYNSAGVFQSVVAKTGYYTEATGMENGTIATDSSGNIYVHDRYERSGRKFSNSGSYQFTFGETLVSMVGVSSKCDMVYIRHTYVSTAGTISAHRFNPDRETVDRLPSLASEDIKEIYSLKDGTFYTIIVGSNKEKILQKRTADGIVRQSVTLINSEMAVDGLGLRVSEDGQRVYYDGAVYDGSGNKIRSLITDKGDKLYFVATAAIAPNGQLYIPDTLTNRVLSFDKDGNFLSEYNPGTYDPNQPVSDGRLYMPRGVAFDSQGNIYVADSNQVQVFDPNWKYITSVGTQTAEPLSAERPYQPEAIAICDDKLYVADRALRIMVFAINFPGKNNQSNLEIIRSPQAGIGLIPQSIIALIACGLVLIGIGASQLVRKRR